MANRSAGGHLSDSNAEFGAAQHTTRALRQAVELRGTEDLAAVPWRALLNDLLAAQAARCRAHVDALVVAIEQTASPGRGGRATEADFTAWAAATSIDPELAGFAANAWIDVLDLRAAAAPTEPAVPLVAAAATILDSDPLLPDLSPDPTPAPEPLAAAVAGDLTDPVPPTVIPGDLSLRSARADDVAATPSGGKPRRRVLIGAALGLVAVLGVTMFAFAADDDGVTSTTVSTSTTTTDPTDPTDGPTGANVEVPNLVGLTAAVATERLADLSLEVENRGETCSELSGVAEGEVNSQDPAWKEAVEPSTVVVITTQRCALTVRVPRLVDATVADALVALEGRGLELGTTATRCEAGTADAVVLAQDPRAGADVDPGSRVDVTINDCSTVTTETTDPGPTETTDPGPDPTDPTTPQNATVPTLVGRTYASADAALADVGLEINVSSSICDTAPGAPANGVVLSQNRSAGSVVPRGTTVSVVLQEC